MSRVDAFLFEWLELRQKLQAPSGATLFSGKGWVFGKECGGCGKPEAEVRTYQVKKRKQTDQVGDAREIIRFYCAHCQRDWDSDLEFQPVQRPKKRERSVVNGVEREMVRLVSLETLLSRLDLRAQRLYLRLFLYEDVRNYQDLADEANRRWPRMRPLQGSGNRAPPRWSEWTARQGVLKSRDKLFDLSMRERAFSTRV